MAIREIYGPRKLPAIRYWIREGRGAGKACLLINLHPFLATNSHIKRTRIIKVREVCSLIDVAVAGRHMHMPSREETIMGGLRGHD